MTTNNAFRNNASRNNTSNSRLEGRVAVVTGATSGIGAATANRLAADGAAVAVVGRREDRLKELAAQIGGTVLPLAVDVSDEPALRRAADVVRAELGRVDLVVANAGGMLAAPFESAATAEWNEMIATNLNGLLYTGRAFVDDLLVGMLNAGVRDTMLAMRSASEPLVSEDIADAIAYAVAAPPRMNVADLIVVPTLQG